MRGLSERFIDDLDKGLLAPIRERVLGDRTLCLEIREDYVNIYYRGGNLLELSLRTSGYRASFNPEYATGDGAALSQALPAAIRESKGVSAWLEAMPRLKLEMDLHMGRHPTEEREAQQLMLRDNNFGGVSRATDYYVCDIEYASPRSRFDMVAVHWPSTPVERKKQQNRRLVLVEAKYGDGAIADSSGIHSHIIKINRFLGDPSNLQSLKEEMVRVFNQKRVLGFVNCGKDLVAFSDAPPMLLLVLVNHDPASSKLRKCFESLPPSPHADVHIATGCLMGYGLFDQAVLPIDDALARLEAYM